VALWPDPEAGKAAVRGETPEIISTGQRATFGLTPALSRGRERRLVEFFPPIAG